jgi:hypothetical protein
MAFVFNCFIWATEMLCVFFEAGNEIIDRVEGFYLLGGSFFKILCTVAKIVH